VTKAREAILNIAMLPEAKGIISIEAIFRIEKVISTRSSGLDISFVASSLRVKRVIRNIDKAIPRGVVRELNEGEPGQINF